MKRKTEFRLSIGLLLQVVGSIAGGLTGAIFGLVLILAGVVFLVRGCMDLAESKGYSKWFGLLGLLNVIGLYILIWVDDCVPDQQSPMEKENNPFSSDTQLPSIAESLFRPNLMGIVFIGIVVLWEFIFNPARETKEWRELHPDQGLLNRVATLLIIPSIFYLCSLLYQRCPSCKRFHALKGLGTFSLGEGQRSTRTETVKDVIKNNDGKEIGHVERNQIVHGTSHITYTTFNCKFCHHKWTRTGSHFKRD